MTEYPYLFPLCVRAHVCAYMPSNECQGQRTIYWLSFCQVGPGDSAQVVKLDDKCLYLLSHHTGLGAHFKTRDRNMEPETWAERCYVVFCTDQTPRGAGKLTWGDPCVQLFLSHPTLAARGFSHCGFSIFQSHGRGSPA